MSRLTTRLLLLATCYSLPIADPIKARALHSISAPSFGRSGQVVPKKWLAHGHSSFILMASPENRSGK